MARSAYDLTLVSFQLWVEGSIFLPKETQEAHTDTLGTKQGIAKKKKKKKEKNLNKIMNTIDTINFS